MRKILPFLSMLYPVAVYWYQSTHPQATANHSTTSKLSLLVPVVYNMIGLIAFARSLRKGPTAVEYIARRIHPDLSAGEVLHCRQITWAWCGFFIFNAAATVILAYGAPLSWWALYTNIFSYGIIGLMIAGEHLLRWYRFPHRRPV